MGFRGSRVQIPPSRLIKDQASQSTGNLKLAMEYIGGTDVRRAREYIQVRPDHLKEAASVMDREHPTAQGPASEKPPPKPSPKPSPRKRQSW
jgi:hypothetical protein